MKRFVILLLPLFLSLAHAVTFYSDWGWGYYYWLFGPVGPSASEGMAAAGYSTLEYRGFTQFSIGGYPGPGTEINSLMLRLRNNTGGNGLQIDINRVTSVTPDWDECGGTAPIYLTNQPVQPDAEQYTYFDLTGTSAKSDFLTAWEGGASWFGLGYKGSRGSGEPCMHFFYAFWADEMYDAALFVDYTVGVEERGEMPLSGDRPAIQIFPNPVHHDQSIILRIVGLDARSSTILRVFDVGGKAIKTFNIKGQSDRMIVWDGIDDHGREVPSGIYFVQVVSHSLRLSKELVIID